MNDFPSSLGTAGGIISSVLIVCYYPLALGETYSTVLASCASLAQAKNYTQVRELELGDAFELGVQARTQLG